MKKKRKKEIAPLKKTTLNITCYVNPCRSKKRLFPFFIFLFIYLLSDRKTVHEFIVTSFQIITNGAYTRVGVLHCLVTRPSKAVAQPKKYSGCWRIPFKPAFDLTNINR